MPPQPEPTTPPTKPPFKLTPTRNPPQTPPAASQIDALYQVYPRKAAPRRAKAAIEKALAREAANPTWSGSGKTEFDFLLDRTKAYAASPAGQKPQVRGGEDFRPYPATWFNGEEYLNDPDGWLRPNGGNAASVDEIANHLKLAGNGA